MGSLFPHLPSPALSPFLRDFGAFFPSDGFFTRPLQNRPFTPHFDVKEIATAYELQGELPGVAQEDIEIEFVDANTLVIKGKTEREDSRSHPSTNVAGETSSSKAAIADSASDSSSTYHKASVEDEYVDAGAEKEGSVTEDAATPESTQATEAIAEPSNYVDQKPEEPGFRYWISERSVGQFQRTFSFPGKVDQEAVKASLKNGILNVVVPKAARKEKKIAIE
ncbi:MAG: hypothetical protein Q9190_003009 [Brigantiaea leucoxantha]